MFTAISRHVTLKRFCVCFLILLTASTHPLRASDELPSPPPEIAYGECYDCYDEQLAICDTCCDPCAPACGTCCGVTICAVVVAVAAIVGVAALIVSISEDESTSHAHLLE